MKKEREFLHELYRRRIFKVPFIEYFRNDKYLRNSLFESFRYSKQDFLENKLLKSLDEISKELDDFKNAVLKEKGIKPKEFSEVFSKSIIYKLENIQLPVLKKQILNDFVNNSENIDLQVSYFLEFNDYTFQKEYGISKNEAERQYRSLKRYANNYIIEYLTEATKKEIVLLERFKHIGYLDYNFVIKELKKHKTISQRLDFLKIIKQDYYDEYEKIKKTISEEDYFFFLNNSKTVWETIFGNHSLITPIQIQEPVHKYYFKNGLNIPEYTYWFLKYNSDYAFNWYINRKEFKSQVNSNLKETFINAELKQLNDFEERAKELLLNKELDIYKPHRNNYNYNKEVVLLRVLDGNYYKENTTYTISGLGSDEVQAYYKHILLKPYLEDLLKGKDDDILVSKENMHLINDEFIDHIRFSISGMNYILNGCNQKGIIPENLSHDYLLKNFIIDDCIKRYYFEPTQDLMTDEYYEQLINSNFIGERCTLLRPYSILICGAYHYRKSMFYKLSMAISMDYKINGNPVKYLSDLTSYFQEYAKGFEIGFNEFKEKCIDPFMIEYSDKNDYLFKVFEYLTKQIIFEHSWFNNHSGFTMYENKEIITNKGFEHGLKQGYFYKAWSIVFSNNQLFKPLFEAYYKEDKNYKKDNYKYAPKEIKIAYFCLKNKSITKDNYLEILEEYSESRSDKILQKPIYKSNQLTSISENKTADTKHLKALKNAKRLLSGIKNEVALKSINQVISTFEANYKNHYE